MKVLLAIDSSPSSQLLQKEAIARPWPAETNFCVATAVEAALFVELPSVLGEFKREAEQLVSAGVAVLARAKLVATSQVLIGSPRKAVSAYAAEWGADLILAGSHGHSAIGRFLLGSVAQGILRTAPCSVEIVRFPFGETSPSSHAMKILVATDGSECSVAAAYAAAGRPWPTGTIFRVLSVEDLIVAETPMAAYSPATIYPASLLEELLADARTRAVKAVDQGRNILVAAGLKVLDQQPLPACDPRVAILDAAHAWPADLIFVGSHGRRGLDRWLMGSVAESVAVHANCSVEVVCKKFD
jgi:nucleotide-binding universal stress UspA family protein